MWVGIGDRMEVGTRCRLGCFDREIDIWHARLEVLRAHTRNMK